MNYKVFARAFNQVRLCNVTRLHTIDILSLQVHLFLI